MLQSIKVNNSSTETKTFSISDPDTDSSIILSKVTGLSSTDLTLFMGDFASEGSYYQGRRLNKRNITLTFDINPDYENEVTATDVRKLLYRVFLSGETGVLRLGITDDEVPVELVTNVIVEQITIDQFSKELSAQVSLIAPYPYLNAAMPYYNTSSWTIKDFPNIGNVDIGFKIKLEVLAATPTVNLIIPAPYPPYKKLTLEAPSGFSVGDIIDINTNQGSRSIQVNYVDKMAYLKAGSDWIQLSEDPTTLQVYGSVEYDGKVEGTEMYYIFKYWGI